MSAARSTATGALGELRERRRARRMQRARTPGLPMLTINMTPMIDCVFLLLTYFILTLDFRPREDALSLDAPERLEGAAAQPPDPFALPVRPVVVTVRSSGDGPGDYALSCDEPALGSASDAAALYRAASAARGSTLPASQAFAVRPLGDARWEHALAAFNALQRAGYTQITLANPIVADR